FSEHCITGGDTQQLTVNKGDRIYFRVHSVENGNPPVNWNPEITYTDTFLASVTDQNGYKVYESSYSDGFILSQSRPVTFPGKKGKVSITWEEDVVVDNPSDIVTFKIIERKINIGTENFEDTEIEVAVCDVGTNTLVSSEEAISYDIDLEANKIIQWLFVVESTSNVKWKDYLWKPVVTTTVPVVTTTVEEEVIGENGEPEGILTSVET